MTTYTAIFRSDAEYASQDFEADTPEQALALARKFYADETTELWFDHYAEMPINEIAIEDADHEELAVWQDDDLRLRLAARDLLATAELVIDRWSEGDLAGAVRQLDSVVARAKGGAQ
jgi:hypothetical protein